MTGATLSYSIGTPGSETLEPRPRRAATLSFAEGFTHVPAAIVCIHGHSIHAAEDCAGCEELAANLWERPGEGST